MTHKNSRKKTGQKNGFKILRNKTTSRVSKRGNGYEDIDERFVDFSRIRNVSPDYF